MKMNTPLIRSLVVAAACALVGAGRGAEQSQGGAAASAAIPAWPAFDWKKAAATPFARVESPTAVVGGRLFLFGGFTTTLAASIRESYQHVCPTLFNQPPDDLGDSATMHVAPSLP